MDQAGIFPNGRPALPVVGDTGGPAFAGPDDSD